MTAAADDAGRADGDAAGPPRGQGPGRRARRLPAAGAAAPDRDRHRPRRAGAHPVRAHPGLGVPVVRRAGPDPAGRAMPRRLAPRPRTRHRPGPGDRGPAGAESPTGPRRKKAGTLLASEGLDTGELDERIGELDEQITDAGLRGTVLPGAAAPPPLDPAPAGRRAAAPPHGQPPDGRQDLHRAGRQDLPAVAVRHADVPVLRPGRRGRSTRRPGHLRLHPRRPRRAALRRAVRPVHPEPAPVHRL